ncbi:MAG: hypothetical protein RMI49_00080 [Candidatus Caldarchaeum sp.]|nr:hypothetical protein [Candidatus Caldarchaeum sp.]
MERENKVSVKIKHGEVEIAFEGEKDDVWEAVNRYFSERLGPVDVLSQLMGDLSVIDAARKLAGKVVVNKERLDVLVGGDAKKRIMLCLAGAWVGKRLGILDDHRLTPKKIASILRVNEKVVRARLSELWRNGWVDKDEEGRYSFKPSKGSNFLEG